MRKLVYLFLAILSAITACTKKAVPDPHFGVTTDSASHKLGDTTWFYFKFNPYNLTFYSGERGHEYRFKDRTNAPGTPELQFTSYRQNGNAADTLQLLISSDFSAQYDSADIRSATWTDITSPAKFSTGSNNTASGIVDLSAFSKDSLPVYLAFRYVGTTHTGVQTTWTIAALTINNILSDSSNTFSVGTIGDGAWASINMGNPAVRWTVSATTLVAKGAAANSPVTEDWVISRGLVLNRALPDVGISLKNISANQVVSYPYIYKAAGTYIATFVGTNTTVYDSKSNAITLTTQINP